MGASYHVWKHCSPPPLPVAAMFRRGANNFSNSKHLPYLICTCIGIDCNWRLKTLVIHANFSTTITLVCPLAHHDRDVVLSNSLTFSKRKLIQRILLAEDWFILVTLTKQMIDGNFSQHGRIIRNAEPHQPVVTNAWDFHWHGLIRFELIKIWNNAYAELKNTALTFSFI